MKSEVEINKQNIKTGDVLYYTDNSNVESYIVIGVDDMGFWCLNKIEDDGEEYFYFNNLQLGWYISEKTKEYNKINFRTQYI